MPDNKISLTIVVNGQAVVVEANRNAPLRTVVPKALEQSGNIGQPPESWELRDAAGQLLDLAQRIEDANVSSEATMFLSLKAGVGG